MTLPPSIGRYRVDSSLGTGAFASVWLGFDDALDAPVAVKVLSTAMIDDLDVRSRFLEEARILRRADSERLISVHDMGELPDRRPYFVMSYADRGTLADRLRDEPLSVDEAVRLAIETALGVAVVNSLGIIHRDLKPSNVLFQTGPTGTERVVIADLGLAKALAHASGVFTLPVGTPGYMSPEQAGSGGGLDVRADVYGLGALAYHLLTGQPPGPAPVRVAPSELRLEIPAAADQVIMRALEMDRDRRWPDADSLAVALSEVRADLSKPPVVPDPSDGDDPGAPVSTGRASVPEAGAESAPEPAGDAAAESAGIAADSAADADAGAAEEPGAAAPVPPAAPPEAASAAESGFADDGTESFADQADDTSVDVPAEVSPETSADPEADERTLVAPPVEDRTLVSPPVSPEPPEEPGTARLPVTDEDGTVAQATPRDPADAERTVAVAPPDTAVDYEATVDISSQAVNAELGRSGAPEARQDPPAEPPAEHRQSPPAGQDPHAPGRSAYGAFRSVDAPPYDSSATQGTPPLPGTPVAGHSGGADTGRPAAHSAPSTPAGYPPGPPVPPPPASGGGRGSAGHGYQAPGPTGHGPAGHGAPGHGSTGAGPPGAGPAGQGFGGSGERSPSSGNALSRRTLLLIAGVATVVVVTAAVVLVMLVTGEDKPKAPADNWSTVRDSTGRITVRVPPEWKRQPTEGWTPGEVQLSDPGKAPALRATPDLAKFRSVQQPTPGVFVGLSTDVTPDRLPPPGLLRRGCTAQPGKTHKAAGMTGTLVTLTCQGGISYKEVGLYDPGKRFSVWVEVKQVGGKDLTDKILSGLRIRPQ